MNSEEETQPSPKWNLIAIYKQEIGHIRYTTKQKNSMVALNGSDLEPHCSSRAHYGIIGHKQKSLWRLAKEKKCRARDHRWAIKLLANSSCLLQADPNPSLYSLVSWLSRTLWILSFIGPFHSKLPSCPSTLFLFVFTIFENYSFRVVQVCKPGMSNSFNTEGCISIHGIINDQVMTKNKHFGTQ